MPPASRAWMENRRAGTLPPSPHGGNAVTGGVAKVKPAPGVPGNLGPHCRREAIPASEVARGLSEGGACQ